MSELDSNKHFRNTEGSLPQISLAMESDLGEETSLSEESFSVDKQLVGSEKLEFELAKMQAEVEPIMSDFGLDFFPQIFQLVTTGQMDAIAARDGFPVRYPHWRFGMSYDRYQKQNKHGLSKLYELVINTDPSYAFMLEVNTLQEHRVVMAHVYAHNDFFKNNHNFTYTNRKMIDRMGSNSGRVKRHIREQGFNVVESFIDACLSLEDLIDIHSLEHSENNETRPSLLDGVKKEDPPKALTFPAEAEMDRFINPPELVKKEQGKLDKEEKISKKRFPRQPERDVLLFLMKHAGLDGWQKDILGIIREEAYYFAPQRQTKIMNEGWASFWHSRAMTDRLLSEHESEIVDYCVMNSSVIAPSPQGFNPYRLGLMLFRDIEERWNKGKHGPEYEACKDRALRRDWDKKEGLGLEKIFEVREIYNDVTFIDTFLTPELVAKEKIFAFEDEERSSYGGKYDQREIYRDFEKIKSTFLKQLVNFGQPVVRVVNGNYHNRSELLLKHQWSGETLDPKYTTRTLENLFTLWTRPVHIVSKNKSGTELLYSYDGVDHTTQGKEEGEDE